MQPYQQASEESTKQSYRPIQAAAAIGAPALKIGLGGKVMSMLNQYIPANLAVQGLSKIDPRLGKFANLAQEAGHSFDEIKGFIQDKISSEEKESHPAKEGRNIVQQYSPELNEFMTQEIGKGRSPIEAGAIAQNDKRFKEIISKISKDHKTPWSSLLESIYGMVGNKSKNPISFEQFEEKMQQGQPNQQMQPQQQQAPGQGQQALMAILQKINQRMGGGQ